MSGPGELPDDLREYYYSAQPDVAVRVTIEMRHSAFLAEDGVTPEAVRLVDDSVDLVAALEADAPMNAGETVTFKRARFVVTPPKQSQTGLPTLGLAAENVSAILMPYLTKAAATDEPIQLTVREYRSDQLGAPALVHSGLTIKKSHSDTMRVSGTAGYEDFINRPHPAFIYTLSEYQALAN